MKKAGLILLTMFLSAAALVFAQPERGLPPRRDMDERNKNLKEELNLTDKQESQVKKLHLALERSQAEIQSKIRLAHLDMKEIYLSDKLDRAGIEKSIKQVSDLEYQMKMSFVEFWFSVNGILNTDQQKLWKKHVGEHIANARDHMRPPMHDGGPMMHERRMMYDPHDGEQKE